jgi:hypothetical protein
MSDYPQCMHCHGASWAGSDPDPECPWCHKPMLRRDLAGELREALRERDEARAKLPIIVRYPIPESGDYDECCSVCGALTSEPHEPKDCMRTAEAACEQTFEALSEMVDSARLEGGKEALKELLTWFRSWVGVPPKDRIEAEVNLRIHELEQQCQK